jgi:acyl CoA:acetate/3-ketoacid CoA transferase beta subunit
LVLREVAPSWTPAEVQGLTEAKLNVPAKVPEMKLA